MAEMKSLTLNDKKYDCFVDSVARELAAAAAVIKSASGESISVSDSGDNKFYNLKIYGKTIQDGTPTPESSADLVSAGDSGSITLSVAGDGRLQHMIIATPNGLPGLPVTSGGNYTDAHGQQWMCDEIDLARGVYVQRVEKVTPSKNVATRDNTKEYSCDAQNATVAGSSGLCNVTNAYSWDSEDFVHYYVSRSGAILFLPVDFDVDTNVVEVLCQLATPVETPLSEEEIAAYNALRTYRGGTTVSNDASAYMELDYAMDAKTYIDLMLGAAPVRLAEVNLPASQWTGSNGLYSQVVTIGGVTEYTKVDLLPSVEQLAIFYSKNVTFVTENEGGVVTVYAIGDEPTQDYTMQVQMTEVVV